MTLRPCLQGGSDAQLKRPGQMIDHLRRVIDHRQIHQPDPILIMLQEQFGHPQRHGGLADAAGTGQGHEAPNR
ncbi:hypothetical protein D3C84_742700 [compost metagenome]